MTTQSEHEARCDLAMAHRIAVMDGLNEGTWNHFSLMSPVSPEQMLISPGDTHWSQVRASNITLMGPQAELISGPAPNPAAWIIHYPVHMARPDAKCIMHTHPPFATALSMRKDYRLDTRSSQAAAWLHDDVAYFDTYDGELRAAEEGKRMAAALGAKRILILRNHGVLTAAPTVAQAYMDLYMLERACMFQIHADGADVALNRIPKRVAKKIGESGRKGRVGHFEGMRQVIEAREPDFRR